MKLIVEMEMPKACPCDLIGVGYAMWCSATCGIPERVAEYDECVKNGTRPDWCPIIGVLPEEHGDSIDRDKLKRAFCNHCDGDEPCSEPCVDIGLIETAPTVDAVPVVFINDPFHVVYQAFKELYPDKECEIMFDYNVETTDTHERVKGVTIFPDDGSIPQIRIDCEQTIDQISGILAHELAHVALGKPEWDDRELDHGDDFERTLDAIFDRFNELQGFCADGKRRTDE